MISKRKYNKDKTRVFDLSKATAESRAVNRAAQKLVTSNEKKLIATVEHSITLVRNQVRITQLTSMITVGDVGKATEYAISFVGEFSNEIESISKPLLETFMSAGELETVNVNLLLAKHRPKAGRMIFDSGDTKAAEFMRKKTLKSIKQITDGSRAAIKDILKKTVGVEAEYTPIKAARLMRESIGLNERQANALEKFRGKLVKQELSDKVINKKVERYSTKLINARAKNIARTETSQAVSNGRKQSWEQAQKKYALDNEKIERTWTTAKDDNICEICEEMDGKKIFGIDAVWTLPTGEQTAVAFAHNLCRCSENVVYKGW